MSLHFCGSIHSTGSAFGVNKKICIHLALYQWLRLLLVVWWCEQCFFGTLWSLGTTCAAFKHNSLPQYCWQQFQSLWLPLTCLLMAAPSRIHTVPKSSQTGFLNRKISSVYWNGLQSPDVNPIELIWDVMEWKVHIMDVQTTSLQYLCYHVNMHHNSEEYFQHLVNPCCEEDRRWPNLLPARWT